jgi:hypothetical protein
MLLSMATHSFLKKTEDGSGETTPVETNQPYINFAMYGGYKCFLNSLIHNLFIHRFRMVALADEILESFCESDLPASFRLQPLPELELPVASTGLLSDIWSSIATDSNKKICNMFTDEIGKTIGKHQVSPTLDSALQTRF